MHSELATVKLEELLQTSGKKLEDLTHLAVVVGPGSFTGIRVGINLARTLAYALSIPVAPFNALSLLAYKSAGPGERVTVALKAVQNAYYGAAYLRQDDGVLEIAAPVSVERAELEALAKGPSKLLIEGEATGFPTAVEARELVEWLERWPKSRHFFSWKDVKPLYIRGSEAEEKLRKGLLKPL
jgi:tRNA threonylcarbamoyladenosine biosynthesis protein TsaB